MTASGSRQALHQRRAASHPFKPCALQAVITSLQYNHTGTNYFNVNKDRPFNRIMDTARDIMREALPIKCIEGAILGLYFTCGQVRPAIAACPCGELGGRLGWEPRGSYGNNRCFLGVTGTG